MNLEVKILEEFSFVKQHLQKVSNKYTEDFLLTDVVFVEINNLSDINEVLPFIQFKNEEKGYLMA